MIQELLTTPLQSAGLCVQQDGRPVFSGSSISQSDPQPLAAQLNVDPVGVLLPAVISALPSTCLLRPVFSASDDTHKSGTWIRNVLLASLPG